MRVLALALAACVLAVPAAAAPQRLELLVRDGSHLTLVGRQTITVGAYRALGISGDGRLFSIGGTIVGHAKLPTRTLAWAPTGERAAYVTSEGAVVEWTPATGRRYLEPKGWGAAWPGSQGVAWSRDGALAVSRFDGLWVLKGGSARRIVGPLPSTCCTGGPDIPIPFAWVGDHVLWWRWPGSGSVASDGIALYEDATKLGTTLPYADYTAACGTHVAFASGIDRESTDDKTILFDGRDVSLDPRHSWASPACTAGGRLVATASRNDANAFREPHRAIWQLLPTRRQLTRPPWGWSDEDPRFLPDGSLLFVRSSRVHSVKSGSTWLDTTTGRVMVLSQGKLSQVAEIGYRNVDELKAYLGPFYGHYDWSQFLAVRA